MNAAQMSGHWALNWAVRARRVPGGGLLAGFLVDLVADAEPVREADTVSFPLCPAAHALGVQPTHVSTALGRLSDAGLLTWYADGAPEASDVTVTLLLSFAGSELNGAASSTTKCEPARS
ncbi:MULTISPECIES: helix-turn-helix domain-containing protein [Streptomyces]|uniref:Helix-turn-helix domain-containing protein n=1 Tax=Streptomyces gilvifuscus TaxID=1550617 RepID=A0ABT5FNT3_9ACTN|nr:MULTISPECIES: helix-turn-helix domain-containing protein [Streptomyces]MBK3640283.1 winged helix-turn-helix domain-containing protein [Streptomyces sp. MBT33]MDC2954190.1 helix-turn-helix domain-containing protein [Streptomyces gilvifuscus]